MKPTKPGKTDETSESAITGIGRGATIGGNIGTRTLYERGRDVGFVGLSGFVGFTGSLERK